MKWLHLSDIHMGSELIPGADTQRLREQLLTYLAEEVGPVDWLFLTGDYRYCGQPNTPEQAWHWIRRIANAVKLSDISEQVCMAPGNHDIARSNVRKYLTDGIRQNYNPMAGVFEQEELAALLQGFSYYNGLYQKVYVVDYIEHSLQKHNPHIYKDCGEFCIYMLNTALLSNEDEERGSLLVGTGHVSYLESANGKPVIALGHHGLELLAPEERRSLKTIFKEKNVKLYLCGDAHELYEDCQGEGLYQITSGCICRSSKDVDAAFTTGEIAGGDIKVTAHEWRGNWAVNPHFGTQGVLQIGGSSGWNHEFKGFEPRLWKHFQEGVQNYEREDVQIHTPQILLLLLQYPGSIMKRSFDQYRVKSGSLALGDYLCSYYKKVNAEQKACGMHFNWGIEWNALLGLELAKSLMQRKKYPYITENLLSYAVLSSGRSNTVKQLQLKLGVETFEMIKQRILYDGTEVNFVQMPLL